MVKKRHALSVDEEIWKRAKAKAALEGMTLQETFEKLLKGWADDKIEIERK